MSPENVNPGLAGLRLLSLESRRADQMARLIENHGGVGLVAPSMREIPLKENPAALAFAEELFAGKFGSSAKSVGKKGGVRKAANGEDLLKLPPLWKKQNATLLFPQWLE